MAEQTLLGELIAKIQQAKDEAIKRCILANAVAVSKDLYFSMFPTSGTPMICGLKAMPTVELPDNTAFAVFELPFLTSNTPTADVVEVVRCKDCEYCTLTEDGEYNPEDIVCGYFMTDGMQANDFCSYGERRHKEVQKSGKM